MPQPAKGSFTHWEPGELRLVRPEATAKDIEKDTDDDNLCVVHNLEVFQDGKFQRDDGLKFAGPIRLRLHVGLKPEIKRAKFRYYFEHFGDVAFPA